MIRWKGYLLIVAAIWPCIATDAGAGSTDIVVVVNPKNPVASMSRGELSALYKRRTKEFSDGNAAAIVNLPLENPIRQSFDKAVLNLSGDDVKRFWLDMKIRSGTSEPRKVPTPDAVARFVATTPNAVGYLPASDVKGLKIVARIAGGNVVGP